MTRKRKTIRCTPHRIGIHCGLLLMFLATIAQASPLQQMRISQQQAVLAAREGQLPRALQELAALRQQWPEDRALLHDEIVVLSWSGDDLAVVERAVAIDPATAPVYVASAVAKSSRNLQRHDDAANWYRVAIEKQPDQPDFYLGLAMTEAEGGRMDAAWTAIRRVPPDLQKERAVRLARAYLYEAEKRSTPALAEYGLLLEEDPDDTQALRGKALALRSLLLPTEALALVRDHPGILNDLEMAHLEADDLTLAMRVVVLGEAPVDDPYGELDRVLQRFDERIAQQPTPAPVLRRLHSDRLVALVERYRFAEAIQEYEALRTINPMLPAYVHAAAGQAYLKNRQPNEALVALREAKLGAPKDVEIDFELFYAYSELERFDDALSLTDGMVQKLMPIRHRPGARENIPNPAHMQAKILSAVGRAYADRLAESQQRLESLVAAAPGNTEARHELANVYYWRGWTDRAAAQYAQILTLSPDLLSVRVDQSIAELDRQNFSTVAGEVAVLHGTYEDHPEVRDLQRRWDLHNRNHLLISTNWGDSSGTTFGSSQYDINSWWFSRPFSRNYRAFSHTFDSQAEFPAGDISRRRVGMGLDYRRGQWGARTEVHFDRADLDDPGVAGRVDYRWSDRWSVEGLLALNSNDIPLRAHRTGISSNMLGLGIGYRRDESMQASSGLRYQDFSDGNRRSSLFFEGRQRWITTTRYKLDMTGNLFTSFNSLNGVAYFNPSRDTAAELGLDNRWRLYRHYDRHLILRLHGQAGIYDQRHFGNASIWSMEGELIWAAEDALEFSLGWRRDRRVYDGIAEYGTFYLASLDGRF